MKYLRPLLLTALAAVPLAVCVAAEPGVRPAGAGPQASADIGCRRLAREGDEKIRIYCGGDPGSAAAATNVPGTTTSCRRLIQPGEKKIHRFCGNSERWDNFDIWAVHAEVSCRWPDTADELCLSPAQWESFDLETGRRQLASGDSSKAAPPIDEVTVGATRTLAELRRQINLAQDRFIAKYNELNRVPEFAISCGYEAPTGSNFLHHVCRATFSDTAMADDSRQFLNGLRGEMRNGSMPASMVVASKQDAFHKNMLALASTSPELRRLSQEHQGLEQRYNDVLRSAIGRGK